MSSRKVTGKINAGRLLAALGRIGYKPESAILDIVDNSVSARATKIDILLTLKQDTVKGKGRKRAALDCVTIKDTGKGMDEEGLTNALSIGSSDEFYDTDTLSKFGMGLKSASSSIGGHLKIITRNDSGKALVGTLDLAALGQEYIFEIADGAENDISALDDFCGKGKPGTFVTIGDIHEDSLPPVSQIIQSIEDRAGVIYYYYLAGLEPAPQKLSLSISYAETTKQIEAYDPLFISEIDQEDPNLDGMNWDGVSVKWLSVKQDIQLSAVDGGAKAKLEMTQLPHPPLVGKVTSDSAAECRRKYNIGAGNYGFYIYRNGRLISWADPLNGLISQDQQLYSFRGRLLIDDTADDALNIDVTKSRIVLSELAWEQVKPIVTDAKKASQEAWSRATRLANEDGDDPLSEVNEKLDEIADEDEAAEQIDESTLPSEERPKRKRRKKEIIDSSPADEDESKRAEESGQRIQYVEYLPDNMLWQRVHSPDGGILVRVSKAHRLYRDLVVPNYDNKPLTNALSFMFFALAQGEYDTIYGATKHDAKVCEAILNQFRENVGDRLNSYLKRISE